MSSPGEAMPSPVLVTGGTGRLGRLVVPRLRDAGCDVRVLTRRGREATDGVRFLTGDLRSGEGVDAAMGSPGTAPTSSENTRSVPGAERLPPVAAAPRR